MPNKKNSLVLIISILFISAPFLVILQGQTSQETYPKKESKISQDSISDIKKNFPRVGYSNDQVTDEVRAIRSEKYDKYKTLEPNIIEDNKEVLFADWLTTNSPLPIEESQIIVLGKVINANAYLSNNKNSVYSDFEIEIKKIFKESDLKQVQNGTVIHAEREGGIVRYPSGKETWYSVSGQRMPKVGSEYLFFLTHNFPLYGYQKKDLFLLTAYELSDGLVFPLDSPNGGTHPIATFYKEKKESILLSDLQNALKNFTNILPNE